ncbi:chloride channel protein [Elizabethkingia meningoseptica]|uniref:chloride channel protein n=1 Tax=Elizabethkingia meningoseptica TaxID=238 RepID=UPI003892884D
MQKVLTYIFKRIKKGLDNIRNEKLKDNLLQAIPFWVASIITGLIAVLYAKIFGLGEFLLFKIFHWKSWLIFIITPAGFILSWWLVERFAPYAKGSGIPQVMASVDLANPRDRYMIKYLLSFKIIIIKIISSFVLITGGGIIGREGPTIQIAGSVFRKVNELLPSWWPKISQKNMILTGAAAGLSAAFNTPLGGVVFAIEELAKTHISYFKTALFTAVIIAGLTAETLAGPYLYLGYPKTSGTTLWLMFPVILIAAISGILSSYISLLMLKINRFRAGFRNKKQHILFLTSTALIIASLAFFIDKNILGSGKELMEHSLFTSDKHQKWYMPLLKMMGSTLSFTSGGSGGIFAPALSIGAGIGSVFSGFAHFTPEETNVIILAGMVAFLTGITRAPFTSAILVLEMTDRHSLIFHLMLAGMASSIASMLISRHSLYDLLKMGFMDKLNKEVRSKKDKLYLKDLVKKK